MNIGEGKWKNLQKNLVVEDYVILSTLVLNSIFTTLAGFLRQPWPFAMITYLVALILVLTAVIRKNTFLGYLILFGLVTGVVELITDWYHVAIFKSLVYDDLSFFPLLASPEYMPIGWMNVITQMSYIGWRLSQYLSVPQAMIVLGVIGALSIPYYEEMAYIAGAWHYQNAFMISHTPLWVFLAYFVEIPWVVPIIRTFKEKPFYYWVLGGVIQGIVIFVGGFFTYLIFSLNWL